MSTTVSAKEAEAIINKRESDGLPDDCRRTMVLMVKMTDEPLSHEELAEFAMHMASCPECSMVSADLNSRGRGSGEDGPVASMLGNQRQN